MEFRHAKEIEPVSQLTAEVMTGVFEGFEGAQLAIRIAFDLKPDVRVLRVG
jgi:hypothetical protein